MALVCEMPVTQIREKAKEHGITCSKMWERLIQEAESASSSTDPGVILNTSHNLCR